MPINPSTVKFSEFIIDTVRENHTVLKPHDAL